MLKFRETIKLVSLSLITVITSCNYDRTNEVPQGASSLNQALQQTVDQVILSSVSNFKTETDNLQTDVSTFCSAINQPNLTELQAQWKVLSSAWNQLVIYNVGPLNNDLITPKINLIESMRQRGTDYTSTVRANLTSILSDATILNQAYFDGLNFTLVGMLALEVLIFEDSNSPHSNDLTDIVTDYQSNSRKCEFLTGMTQLLNRHATDTQSEWTTNFSSTEKSFRDILVNGELEDSSESTPTLITSIQKHLDYIKKRKLENILDAQIADYFYQNISATLEQIETFLEGNTPESYSFFDHMTNNDFSDQVETVKNNIAIAKQAANDQDRAALTTAIGILDGNFKREIPDSLEVQLGVTFSDGD